MSDTKPVHLTSMSMPVGDYNWDMEITAEPEGIVIEDLGTIDWETVEKAFEAAIRNDWHKLRL